MHLLRPWKSQPRRKVPALSRSVRAPADCPPPAATLRIFRLPHSFSALRRSSLSMEIPVLSAGLADENDVRDFHPLIEGFAHVVDREGCGGNGYQGFHLHARLGGRRHTGMQFHAILA